MICRSSVDLVIQQHLLVHAERVLADHERIGSLSPGVRVILEALAAVMYAEQRIALEGMMLLPFKAAEHDE